MNTPNNNIKKKPLKLAASIITATLLSFGAISCSPDANVADNGVYNEDYAVENVSNDDYNYFTEWDSNADQMWDENEFTTGLNETGFYDGWDTNNDNNFTEDEVSEGVFNTWDEDNDGYLDNDEYAAGNGAWEDTYGDNFGTWDMNNDDMLDTNEFGYGMNDSGLYDTWDTDYDGMFSEDEFGTGLYNSWDMDNNGYLGFNEYNEIGFNDWGI